MIQSLRLAVLAGLLVLVAPLAAMADAGAPVQQTATRTDATTFAIVGTNANTVNTQSTATLNIPNSQFAYITRIELEATQDGTASANTNQVFTATGLGTGAGFSPQWTYSCAATANLNCYTRDINFTTPLKTQGVGGTVTVVSPSAITHTAFTIKIYGYFSNQ